MKGNKTAGPVAAEAGLNARPVGQSLLRDARANRTPGRRGRAPFPHLPLRCFHGAPERLLGLLEAVPARRCA